MAEGRRGHALDDERRFELERAYRAHGQSLWRGVYAFTAGSREIADDAVAHAFIQAGPRLAGIRDLRAWLFTVAFREAARELRRRRTAGLVAAAGAAGAGVAGPDVEGGLTEVLDLVRRLSPSQRSVFVLRELLGYPTSEAARLLGISEVAVRVHLNGARRRLRASIREAELA